MTPFLRNAAATVALIAWLSAAQAFPQDGLFIKVLAVPQADSCPAAKARHRCRSQHSAWLSNAAICPTPLTSATWIKRFFTMDNAQQKASTLTRVC